MSAFAAAIPQPAHLMPGSALATGIRDALLATSFRAHMSRPEPVAPDRDQHPSPIEYPSEPVRQVCKPARKRGKKGEPTSLSGVRIKLSRERAREARGRAAREAAQAASLTGEELLVAVLDHLDKVAKEEAQEWEKADRLSLPWVAIDQRPAVPWVAVCDALGWGGCKATHLGRLSELAGLELANVKRDRGTAPPAATLISVGELEALLGQSFGIRARQMRRAMKGPAPRL